MTDCFEFADNIIDILRQNSYFLDIWSGEEFTEEES